MKRNNKAIVFEISMILITLILFSTLFVLVLNKSDDFSVKFGQAQMDLFRVYTNQEFHLFNNDQKAKYIAYETFIDLAKKGYNSKCGKIEGYPIWKNNNTDCIPNQEKIKLEFQKHFNDKIKEDYTLSFYKNYILGYPDFELIWSLNSPEEEVKGSFWSIYSKKVGNIGGIGTATVTPNFKQYIAYNLDDINKIISLAQSLKTKKDLKKLPSSWKITEKNNYTLINITEYTDFSLYPKINTKFAIELSKN